MSYLVNNLPPYTSADDVIDLIDQGGRFVVYLYVISLVFVTVKSPSEIYFVPNATDQNLVVQGLPYTVVSALLGWWGIPWGPYRTLEALANNCLVTNLGKDLTEEIYRDLKLASANRRWSHPHYRRYERFVTVFNDTKELFNDEIAKRTAHDLVRANEKPGSYFEERITYYEQRIHKLKAERHLWHDGTTTGCDTCNDQPA